MLPPSSGFSVALIWWIPLCEIDDRTPTIAVGPRLNKVLHHVGDQRGYAVLPSWPAPLTPIVDLHIGDAVVLWPETIHATYVPPNADKSRMSLDLRAVRRLGTWATLKHRVLDKVRR